MNSKLVLLIVSVCIALCNASNLKSMLSQSHGKLGEPFQHEVKKLPPDQWFTQKLDHFNLEDGRTWKQRYLMTYFSDTASSRVLCILQYFFTLGVQGSQVEHKKVLKVRNMNR